MRETPVGADEKEDWEWGKRRGGMGKSERQRKL
jgi:hypothetical protein